MTEASQHVASVVGRRLRNLRTERGLIRTEVAKSTGIAQSRLWMMESGMVEPSIGQLTTLCGAYSISLSAFLEDLEHELDHAEAS